VTIGIVLVICSGAMWALMLRGRQPGETREQRVERLGKNYISYLLATQLVFPFAIGLVILLVWAVSLLI
jgi:hypothetical protein